jgi:hypothetical protein
MKTKDLKRKLTIGKMTVANLNHSTMGRVRGGLEWASSEIEGECCTEVISNCDYGSGAICTDPCSFSSFC